MEIAVHLAKLPRTNHLKESFVVDVSYLQVCFKLFAFLFQNAYAKFQDDLLLFTVQGLFEDGERAKPPAQPILNFFTRSFIVLLTDGRCEYSLTKIFQVQSGRPQRRTLHFGDHQDSSAPLPKPIHEIAQCSQSTR